MRISDWSSDVCSSDLTGSHGRGLGLKRGCLPFGGAHRPCRGFPLACYPERTRREGGEHIAAATEDREDEGATKTRSRREEADAYRQCLNRGRGLQTPGIGAELV